MAVFAAKTSVQPVANSPTPLFSIETQMHRQPFLFAFLISLLLSGTANAASLAGTHVACPDLKMVKSYTKAKKRGNQKTMDALLAGPCFIPPAGWEVEVIKRGFRNSRVLIDAGGGRKWDNWTPNKNIVR